MEQLIPLSASAPANSEYQHLLALCYLEGAAVGGLSPGPRRGRQTRHRDP